MKLTFILIWLLSSQVNAQTGSFDFYGDKFILPGFSSAEVDSLLQLKRVPVRLKAYIAQSKTVSALDDWALVYFLDAFVEAQFISENEPDRVRIINLILTELGINNAIGTMSNGQLLSMVSFDNKFNPIDGAKFYEKDGYKFMPVKRQSKIIKLKHLELYCKAENRDIPLDYAKMPNLQNQILSNKELSFFNYCTKRNDSITFIFSNAYNRYYNDLPRIIPDHHYYMAPVSPAFQNSFFAALDGKMGQCHTRLDSINFLLKLVQTAVQFEEDQTLYGKKDWCSFPENTFALGKGDCEDKSEAFAFLISHYFNKVGIVFLYYANHIGHINHVRVGLNDPNLPLVGRPCKEFEGKSYFEAELQSDDTVLADDFFAIFYETPQFFRK